MSQDYEDGDVIWEGHWEAMQNAIRGNGKVSGLGATPHGSLFSVILAAGVYYRNFLKISYAGGTIALGTPPTGSDLQWFVLSGDGAGTITVSIGTAHPLLPTFPNLPAGDILLYATLADSTMPVIPAASIHEFGFTNDILMPHILEPSTAQKHPHSDIKSLGADDHHNQQHPIGSVADHSASTIALLNALISDATLDDIAAARTPTVHDKTKHTDRTRIIQLNIGGGHIDQVSGAADPSFGTFVGLGVGWLWFDTSAYDFIYWGFPIPADWDLSSNFVVKGIFRANGSGDLVLDMYTQRYNPIPQTPVSPTLTETLTISTAKEVTLINGISGVTSGDDYILFGIARDGLNALDTLNGKWVSLLALWVEYTADM